MSQVFPIRPLMFAWFLAALTLGAGAGACRAAKPAEHGFEKDIQAFEKQDAEHPPMLGQVLFVGSSSIRFWDLKTSFPKLDALNRGFGGSQISDCVYFAKRIVTPYKPRLIVFYAGDNDIAAGKQPEQVAKDFDAFLAAVRPELPDTPIVFLSIKLSPVREKFFPKYREANRLIQADIAKQSHVSFLDVATPLLDSAGAVRTELFKPDHLHLNADGYKIWAAKLQEIVAPAK